VGRDGEHRRARAGAYAALAGPLVAHGIGVPLTTKQHHGASFGDVRILILSSEITSLDPKFGATDTLALCEHVRSFSTERITGRAGRVTPRQVDHLRAALAYLLEL
jgi:mRNA-degrading endonuclease toxin of MazEF toxin-antitoxin module